MTNLKESFNIYIAKLLLEGKPSSILLTVSGGVDSIVMADLFRQSENPFAIAHCNFQLRGAGSDGDELLVESYAKKINVPFYSRRFNTAEFAKTEGISIQMAARQLRYDWFEELRKELQYDFIATAHHADDNMETMLMNFIRGKSLNAISGIPSVNQKIIRPLLFAGKDEIISYAQSNQLEWREDASNQSADYDRNFLRLKVFPLLRELNPSLEKSFSQTSILLKEASTIIDLSFNKWKAEYVKPGTNKTMVLNLRMLNAHPLKSNMLYQLLVEYNFQPAVIRQVGENLLANPGTTFLSPTHELIIDRDVFSLEKIGEKALPEQVWIQFDKKLVKAGSSTFEMEKSGPSEEIFTNSNPSIAFIDADLLEYPLLLRHWQDGDTFCPLGMQQFKKLSDFFIDEKVPLMDKDAIWLLTCKGNIVWVVRYRPDDRFKVKEDTKTVLKITFAP